MRESESTQNTLRETQIIAPPPFDPKEPLPVSRLRVRLGIALLIIGLAAGFSAPLFPTAKLWLGGIGLLLIIASFCILGDIVYDPTGGATHERSMHANASNHAPERTAARRAFTF